MKLEWHQVAYAIFLGIVLTYASVFIQYKGGAEIYGNECYEYQRFRQPCLAPNLRGGWPAPYLFDSFGISVEDRLAFFQDRFEAWNFLVDFLLYSTVTGILFALFNKRKG